MFDPDASSDSSYFSSVTCALQFLSSFGEKQTDVGRFTNPMTRPVGPTLLHLGIENGQSCSMHCQHDRCLTRPIVDIF